MGEQQVAYHLVEVQQQIVSLIITLIKLRLATIKTFMQQFALRQCRVFLHLNLHNTITKVNNKHTNHSLKI